MKTYNFLAFDIGASSGRAMLGTMEDDKFELREIHRFPNAIMELHGKFYWNIFSLYTELKEGLSKCAAMKIPLDSIGIDTWGVDFGFIAKDGTILGTPRSYRDPYTEGAPKEFFKIIPRQELYHLTGIQIMNFNSLYQLYKQKKEDFAPLVAADELLFMPDLLTYMLTKKKVCEYTIASTSQILNPNTKQFEASILEAAGISPTLMRPLVQPGNYIGTLTEPVAAETGVGKVPVVAVAGHDTASAVAAVPASDNEFAYLSSGTWSLMGVEVVYPIITEESFKNNFTNEGGIDGTTRFLKNITGLWLLEQCRKEWIKKGHDYTYKEIEEMATSAKPFYCFVNPDDPRFANPRSMTKAIISYCNETHQPAPDSDAQFIRCIYESLAFKYKYVLGMLKSMSPMPIKCLHVIGGGSQNRLLNQLTTNAIDLPVIAGPKEATAIGNIMMQAKTAGIVENRWEMRKLINTFVAPETFMPAEQDKYEKAYAEYLKVMINN